jgi:hypothetical protein
MAKDNNPYSAEWLKGTHTQSREDLERLKQLLDYYALKERREKLEAEASPELSAKSQADQTVAPPRQPDSH